MALNFPDSPTLNQVYTDNTSGFSYQWNGTVWISFSPSSSSQIKTLDDFSGSFDDVTQTFSLTSNGNPITPSTSQSLIINLGGVIQDPTDDYSVAGSNITFATPPANGLSFSGISLGPAVPINTIPDGTVTDGSLRISTTAVVGSATTFTEDLVVSGDARVIGILTIGTSSITLDGNTDVITVGSGVTIDGNSGSISASSFVGDGSGLTGVGVGTEDSINTTGIITASAFVGDGSGLTGLNYVENAGISTYAESSGISTVSQGLTGTPDIIVGIITATTVNDTAGDLRDIPQNPKTASYTLIASDAGKHISITTGGVTVPASVFSIGDAVTIFNNSSSNQTITQGASVTLRNAGTTNTGNRTLGAYGVCTVLCVASNVFVISGAGLS